MVMPQQDHLRSVEYIENIVEKMLNDYDSGHISTIHLFDDLSCHLLEEAETELSLREDFRLRVVEEIRQIIDKRLSEPEFSPRSQFAHLSEMLRGELARPATAENLLSTMGIEEDLRDFSFVLGKMLEEYKKKHDSELEQHRRQEVEYLKKHGKKLIRKKPEFGLDRLAAWAIKIGREFEGVHTLSLPADFVDIAVGRLMRQAVEHGHHIKHKELPESLQQGVAVYVALGRQEGKSCVLASSDGFNKGRPTSDGKNKPNSDSTDRSKLDSAYYYACEKMKRIGVEISEGAAAKYYNKHILSSDELDIELNAAGLVRKKSK